VGATGGLVERRPGWVGTKTRGTSREERRFRAVFEAEHRTVLAYALRRTTSADDAPATCPLDVEG
jgi:hypothetical protein